MVLAKCGSEHREDFGVEDNVKAKWNCLLRPNIGTHLTNSNGGGLHILIVEHDLGTAENRALLLRCYGHQVRVASTGFSACQAALHQPPDVVLLELALPDVDGWEVVRALAGAVVGQEALFHRSR